MALLKPSLEKRRCIRVPISGPVHFATSRKRSVGEIVNVSSEGMMLKVWDIPEPDEWVQVCFRLPHSDYEFKLNAIVVWASSRSNRQPPRGVGIRFHDLKDEDQTQLDLFIESNAGSE